MKKLILIAVAAVVVIGGAVLSVQHYHKYQNKKQAAAISQAETAKQAQYKADKAIMDLQAGEVTRLGGECQKGANAYAQLPVAAKAKIAAPVCSSPTAAR